MRVFALCSLLLAGVVLAEKKKSYRGYQVISVSAQNERQVHTLQQLHDSNPELIFLSPPTAVRETEIVVPPRDMVRVLNTLRAVQLTVTLQSADLQAEFDAVMAENMANHLKNNNTRAWQRNSRYSPPHNVYYKMDDVDNIMLNFANAYPNLAVRKALSRHSELNRKIYYLELGTPGSNKPVIFIEGLAHAREWIVTASLIYTIDMLLSGYASGDQQATDALTKYTWIIIPVVNPDGYMYTWSTNRMWRKNRKYISNQCTGIDLNRNYDVDFANTGASSRCQDDTYHGGSPFSEAETQNVYSLFNDLKSRVVSFLSVHAYSQLLLYPWGYVPSNYDPSPPSNRQQLIDLGLKMQEALQSSGKTYDLGTAYGVLGYAASGAAEDWALQEKPGIYAYCYELRPRSWSQGGFDIPPSQIVPTGQELLASLYVLAEGI